MSSYETQLGWYEQMSQFTPAEHKILLALSNEEYKWRAKDRLEKVTGLKGENLDTALAKLIRKELVRPAFSKNKNLIFGLRERVD